MKKQFEIPKKNELRVGNYFCDESEDHSIVQVTEIRNSFIIVFWAEDLKLYPSTVYKIPLTEEMLYRLAGDGCNIEQISEDDFVVDRFKLIWKEGYNYWYVVDDMTDAYITKVEWVHEFQNMYYALNGKELTV